MALLHFQPGLSAEELLYYARGEWSVETMHWLLDVHFGEDYCRVEDKNVQQNLNMLRKLAINLIKTYKERAASKFKDYVWMPA